MDDFPLLKAVTVELTEAVKSGCTCALKTALVLHNRRNDGNGLSHPFVYINLVAF